MKNSDPTALLLMLTLMCGCSSQKAADDTPLPTQTSTERLSESSASETSGLPQESVSSMPNINYDSVTETAYD